MYGKEKENINFENFKNSSTYICLLKDGNGIRYDSGGNVEYKGEFKFNCYNGKGILYSYTYNNDCYIKYDGSFLNGKCIPTFWILLKSIIQSNRRFI